MPIAPWNKHKYPANWKEIRVEILARAGNKCEGSPLFPGCRAANGEAHPETGSRVVLTIAHMDQNPENNDRENLRALCQRCHLRHDIKQHVANREKFRQWRAEKAGQLRLFEGDRE